MVKFVDHDSKGPNICFGTIDVIEEALGRHVEGRPDVHILEIMTK